MGADKNYTHVVFLCVSFYETLGRTYFYQNVMTFGGIVGVFENQEVHVVFSFAFWAAIFHREPSATLFKGQNVDGYAGVEFFERGICFVWTGKVNPSTFRECS